MLKPPQYVTSALRAIYPHVSLRFVPERGVFGLFMRGRVTGDMHAILYLQNKAGMVWPTFDNTVGFLQRSDNESLDTGWRRDAFLRGLDASRENYEAQEEAKLSEVTEQEGGPRLWHAMKRAGVL
jgi:hypothetical protein